MFCYIVTMRLFDSLRLCLILASLLVFVQAVSLGHAAEHGDHPHEHDGIECELQSLAAAEQAILPTAPEPQPIQLEPALAPASYTSTHDWAWPPERAPPPRGPPSINQ